MRRSDDMNCATQRPSRPSSSELERQRTRRRAAHRRVEGAAALEFALVLPFFALLMLGMIDFAHLFFVKAVLTNAAREGARTGAVQATQGSVATAAHTAAVNYLTQAGLAGGSCRIDCATSTETFASGPDITVTVTVSGAFQNISGFTYRVLPGMTNPFAALSGLNAQSTIRWESYVPPAH